ncbi:MAG: hypothetical protein HUJ88_09280 [Fusobacterium necrophorum]|nr:hypothetical protein [Fusobacterium necrophorum]
MSISLDGNKIINDKNRRFLNGNSVYRCVVKNINKLKKNQVNFQIISTVNEKTDFLNNVHFFRKMGIQNIKYSFLYSDDLDVQYDEDKQKKMLKSFIESLNWLVQYNKKNKKYMNILNVKEIINIILLQNNDFLCIPGKCCAGKKIMSIDFEGNILPCDNYNILKEVTQYNFILENTFHKKCQKCCFLFACQGGCPVERKDKKDRLCIFKKGVYEYIFNKIVHKEYRDLINLI